MEAAAAEAAAVETAAREEGSGEEVQEEEEEDERSSDVTPGATLDKLLKLYPSLNNLRCKLKRLSASDLGHSPRTPGVAPGGYKSRLALRKLQEEEQVAEEADAVLRKEAVDVFDYALFTLYFSSSSSGLEGIMKAITRAMTMIVSSKLPLRVKRAEGVYLEAELLRLPLDGLQFWCYTISPGDPIRGRYQSEVQLRAVLDGMSGRDGMRETLVSNFGRYQSEVSGRDGMRGTLVSNFVSGKWSLSQEDRSCEGSGDGDDDSDGDGDDGNGGDGKDDDGKGDDGKAADGEGDDGQGEDGKGDDGRGEGGNEGEGEGGAVGGPTVYEGHGAKV